MIVVKDEWDNLRFGPWRVFRKTALVDARPMDEPFQVETLEGTMVGAAGDYLCYGVEGELWPVKKSVFEASYEEVSRGGVITSDILRFGNEKVGD